MSTEQRGHRWFAAFWKRMVKAEPRFVQELRDRTLAGLSGRVLEIGAGNGANFHRYPDAVSEIVATEPDPYMLRDAEETASQLKRSVTLKQASAESLPFADGEFDAVVSTLVLCTVQDPEKALAEIRRVLKPGGELRFFEHVRYDGGFGAFLQDAARPVWHWVGAGCRPNQDTEAIMRSAGFEFRELQHVKASPPIPPMCFTRPCIQGAAIPS
jgi:ubiquinone/menaquinone biosynthesis C-methylase UbiE